MIAKYWERSNSGQKALSISVAAHILVFLLLLLFAEEEPIQMLFQVKFVPVQERIPVKDRQIIKKELKKVEKIKKQQALKQKNKFNQQRKTQKQNNTSSTVKDNRQKMFEKFDRDIMSTKKGIKSIPTSKPSKGKTYAWNKGIGQQKKGKQMTGENVKVPSGRTTAGRTTWFGRTRRAIRSSKPAYPEIYRRRSVQCSVTIKFGVKSTGTVVNPQVVRSCGHSRLDINAKNAMRRFRFSPGTPGQIDYGQKTFTYKLR